MVERGIVSEESNPYQYRFVDITDPESGKVMFEIEHEVRCVDAPDVPPPAHQPEPGPAPADLRGRPRRAGLGVATS